jgi:hypothetical protein
MNKLPLLGMQKPEKYKENFDVSSEGPSSGVRGDVHIQVATQNVKLTFWEGGWVG